MLTHKELYEEQVLALKNNKSDEPTIGNIRWLVMLENGIVKKLVYFHVTLVF